MSAGFEDLSACDDTSLTAEHLSNFSVSHPAPVVHDVDLRDNAPSSTRSRVSRLWITAKTSDCSHLVAGIRGLADSIPFTRACRLCMVAYIIGRKGADGWSS
ncbi:hypothetical protein SAMN04488580_103208 [Mycobacterium sp. 283mftsu]|nr:hypothetical protein SAMN04488580_103208 [Mycobacterium sp. 283mftsu]